jgi:predicted deacylase
VIARLGGGEAGPLLIAIGGLHGNEPSGVEALGRVAAALDSRTLRGDVIMVAGNLGALAAGRRFVDHDLNRGWSAERLATLRGQDASAPRDAEDREQLALALVIDRALASARGPVFLLDLHATSAEGIPFALCRDDPAARRFAAAFPITVVLGLIESLSGTLAGFLGVRATAVVVEGGRNSSPATVGRHEAVVWLALAAAGILDPGAVPALEAHRDALTRARGDLPRTLNVEHRHAIAPGDRFRMEPGFSNIHRIQAGELLARDRSGAIHAPEAGFLVMPLYQAMGDDGFFLGRDPGDEPPDV